MPIENTVSINQNDDGVNLTEKQLSADHLVSTAGRAACCKFIFYSKILLTSKFNRNFVYISFIYLVVLKRTVFLNLYPVITLSLIEAQLLLVIKKNQLGELFFNVFIGYL